MIKSTLAVLLLPVSASLAWADQPGADWLTKGQVTQKLTGMGYTDIRKLEADDGHWEGDATKAGVAYEIHVDPHSGALTKNEPKRKGEKDHDDD